MSEVEYLAGFISILVGLSVAEIAQSTHRLLRCRARVRFHWYPFAAALILLLLTIELWWNTNQVIVPGRPVTIGLFLPIVIGLFLLYLTCAAVLPDEIPAEGLDLRAHYFDNARYFWSLFAVLIAGFIAVRLGRNIAYLGWARAASALPGVAPNMVMVLLFASLGVVRRSWWHTLVLAVMPLLIFAAVLDRPLPVEQKPAAPGGGGQAAASPMPSSPSLR